MLCTIIYETNISCTSLIMFVKVQICVYIRNLMTADISKMFTSYNNN